MVPLQSSVLPDSIGLENLTFSTELFSTKTMALEWAPLSMPVQRDFGVGGHPLKAHQLMESLSISS